MTSSGDLLAQLLAIDRALADGKTLAARAMMADAEDAVIRLQQELMVALQEKQTLERRLQALSAAPPAPQTPASNVIAMPARAPAQVTAALKPK